MCAGASRWDRPASFHQAAERQLLFEYDCFDRRERGTCRAGDRWGLAGDAGSRVGACSRPPTQFMRSWYGSGRRRAAGSAHTRIMPGCRTLRRPGLPRTRQFHDGDQLQLQASSVWAAPPRRPGSRAGQPAGGERVDARSGIHFVRERAVDGTAERLSIPQAVWGRSLGYFSRQRWTTASRPQDAVARSDGELWRRSFICIQNREGVSMEQWGATSISYRMTPTL